MYQNPQKQTIQTPENPLRSIGKKHIIIPDHITKIVYRQGEGPLAKSGASIKTYYSCHTIDGQQIIKKRNLPKRFSIGIGRLIEGLEIVFLTVKKNQKFMVFISPEYGYKDIEIDKEIGNQLGGIPVNQKLVFQFQVLSIDYFGFGEKCEADILVEVRNKFKQIVRLVDQNQSDKALKQIDDLLNIVELMKYYKTDIKMMVLLKKTHIYFNQQKYIEALKQTQSIFNVESTNPHFLILISQIHLKLKNYSLASTYMNKLHQLYGHNLEMKRVFVDYLKKVDDKETLRNLEGYNYDKDQVFQPRNNRRDHGYNRGELRMNRFNYEGFGFMM